LDYFGRDSDLGEKLSGLAVLVLGSAIEQKAEIFGGGVTRSHPEDPAFTCRELLQCRSLRKSADTAPPNLA
jgi:hypothetical protein